jgi:hypothetical protein
MVLYSLNKSQLITKKVQKLTIKVVWTVLL